MASTPTADAYTRPGATCWNSCLKPHDNGCKWWNMGLQVSAVHKMLANVELELQAERLGLDANVEGNASWRLSRLTIVSNILTFGTTRSADSNLVHRTNDHMRALEKRRFFQEIGRNKTDISLGPRCLLFAPPWFHQFCVKPSSTERRSYVARGESQQLRWPSWLPSAPEGRNMNVLPRNSQLHFYVFHSCRKIHSFYCT